MRSLFAFISFAIVIPACTGTTDTGEEPITEIPAPSDLTATRIGLTAVRLAWKDQSNTEDSFVVERMASGSVFIPTVFVPKDMTTAVDSTGLLRDSTYLYRVRAVRFVITSPHSNTVSMTYGLPFP